MEKLKYPIGKPEIPNNISSENIAKWIETIEDFPKRLNKLVSDLSTRNKNFLRIDCFLWGTNALLRCEQRNTEASAYHLKH